MVTVKVDNVLIPSNLFIFLKTFNGHIHFSNPGLLCSLAVLFRVRLIYNECVNLGPRETPNYSIVS